MTPDPTKTPLELADEFDVAARIAYDKNDYHTAEKFAMHAHLLRMEDQQERKNANLKSGN